YRTFTAYGENQKSRLEIRPANHRDPPKLPKWLRIPYLKPCKGIDNHINLETNLNNRIQTEAGLWKCGVNRVGIDCSIDAVGALGPVMKSDNNVYVGLTTGHVLPDGDRALIVKSDNGELEGMPKNVTIEEASDPMARPRAFYLNKATKKAPLKVFKSGSATGPTAGELVGLTRESPPGEDNIDEGDESSSNEDKEQEDEEEESEDNEQSEDGDGMYGGSESEDEAEDTELGHEWLGEIKWL
ncbi:hypothetical protein MMC31_002758, partial [Peltigera leucophlebia]|nr:hypothetical protein [Peltigera leucophlebia]